MDIWTEETTSSPSATRAGPFFFFFFLFNPYLDYGGTLNFNCRPTPKVRLSGTPPPRLPHQGWPDYRCLAGLWGGE